MIEIEVVTVGGLHHNMLGVIRALGQKGIKKEHLHVILVGHGIPNKNIISKSKYTNIIEYVDDDECLIETLLKIAVDGKKRVIICCSDGSASVVMKNTIILNKMYYTPTVKKDIEELMDKSCQTEIAKVCGLNIPKSMVMRKGDKIIWNDFPCIIKPIKSFIGGGKSDIHIASSYEELCNDFNNTVAETIQVQKYIKKRIEYQIIGCSLNAGEICIIPGYTDIIRQPQNTNTGYLRYSPIVKLDIDLEKIRAFIRNIGYSGLFSVEFIRAEDNKDYFLEINMRNDGNAYCVTAAGVNLPYIWAYYNIYNQFPIEEKRDFINDVILIPDFADIGLGIRTIGVFKWFIQMITADCHTVWNKNDINPFFCDMQVFLVRNIKKVLKRIIP